MNPVKTTGGRSGKAAGEPANDAERGILAEVIGAVLSIAPEVDAAALQPALPLRDQVDLDSMDWLNLIVALHERCGVDIPEADYGRLGSLTDIVGYIAARAPKRAPGAVEPGAPAPSG